MLAVALAGALVGAGAQAQTFPSKPITIVIPLAAGGAVDTMVRTMTESMRASLGQPILVENVGGAGGTIGINRVVRAAPDGYTISVGTWGTHVANCVHLFAALRSAEGSRAGGAAAERAALVHRPEEPAADEPAESCRLAEGQPGRSRPDRSAPAAAPRSAAIYFQKATGTSSRRVPYRGGAPALQDMVAGQIDMMCDLAANSLTQVKAGNIKAYAVTSKKRWFAAPDVPTVEEAGVPGLDVTTWHGAYAPKGTPKDAVMQAQPGFQRRDGRPDGAPADRGPGP